MKKLTPEEIVKASMKKPKVKKAKSKRRLKNDARLKSLTESFTNIAIGFPINFGANLAILPFYATGFGTTEDSLSSAFQIGIWFTIISIVRSYGLRRLFNKFGEKENFYTLTVRLIKGLKKRL